MKKVLPGFIHVPGWHCGSTALADVMRYRGYNLSEAMCFGLGSGLGFVYWQGGPTPTHALGGRAPNLELTFFANLGYHLQWETARADEVWPAIRSALDRGDPVLALTDLYHLDYYRSHTHFSGHAVVVAGYDDAAIALLADTDRPGLQEVSVQSLLRAMQSDFTPFPVHYQWLAVPPLAPVPLDAPLRQALTKTARDMLAPPWPGAGVPGMRSLADDLPGWASAADWQWSARFAYQVIERRGTGGGSFRYLYSRFTAEASHWIPELGHINAPARFWEAGRLWTALAMLFRRISENSSPGGFDQAQALVRTLVAAEESLYRDILSVLK